MFFRAERLAALLALPLAIAACDSNSPYTNVIYSATFGSYDKLLVVALSGRDVPVYAMAAPFESDIGLAERYAAILGERDKSLRFVGAGSGVPTTAEGVRILLLNDPPKGYTGISACQGKPYDARSRNTNMEFLTIVCNDDIRLVEVRGIIPRDNDNLKMAYGDLLLQTRADMLVKEDKTPR